MTFSEKMKLLREEKGITQQQASDEMGIAISSLRNYENGRLPDTVQLKIIKNYYDVTYEYLLDDQCENRTSENVEIGIQFGLSDKSIEALKNSKEKNILNNFFEYSEFPKFIKYLNLYYEINKLITYDLKLILYICDIWEYILDRAKQGKQEDLKDYFNKCDNAVNNIINFTENTPFFEASDSKYDLFRHTYNALKKIIFNKKIDVIKMTSYAQTNLEELLDLFEEIEEKYQMYSKLIKLNINEIINNFLIPMEKMYDITLGSQDYIKMFGKYIKHINADIREDYKFYSKRSKMNKII